MNSASTAADNCPCRENSTSRSLADAVREDDIDLALALGLLSFEPASHRCDRCRDQVAKIVAARDARRRALAARERYLARQMRLTERAELRARRRATAVTTASVSAAPALPAAAAAALARARARAAAGKTD